MADSSVSYQLDQFLNQLGFSEHDIKERICMFDKCTIARTLSARKIQKRYDIDRIVVGSQREGIGLQYINDTDVLQIYKSCCCFESSNIADLKTLPEAWLELDGTRTYAGYYFLKAHGAFEKLRLYGDIQHLLIQRFGETFLSANKFMAQNDDMFATSNGYLGKHTIFRQRQGPSWPKTVNTFEKRIMESMLSITINGTIDYVRGLPCVCNTVLTNWSYKERKGDWPSTEIISYVVDLPAFVVPVAQKGTAHTDLQWRLCFTLGEMYLLRTLNNTHMKVYVVLKFLAKYKLQPVCPDISSFIMKNVLFWQAESTPFNNFRPDTLVTCVRKALQFLKECLQRNNLPYYMMPERNLLMNKISRKQQGDLLQKLDHIMNESHYLADCLEKIGEGIYLGHLVSKSNICKVSVFNEVDLAIYFESLFNKRNYVGCFMYNIWTVVIPMTYTYGLNVFRDPLSIDIPLKMDVLGSFRRSQLTYTEQSVHKSLVGFIELPNSGQDKVFPGEILQVEEQVKFTVRGTDISIHLYWKLHEQITDENGENKHKLVKKTIEVEEDHYNHYIVGSNNSRTGVIFRITCLRYRLNLLLMLFIAFGINVYSNRFEMYLASLYADECYECCFEMLTPMFEILLLSVTLWKCRSNFKVDVYKHGYSTQEIEETGDNGLAEFGTSIARLLSPF